MYLLLFINFLSWLITRLCRLLLFFEFIERLRKIAKSDHQLCRVRPSALKNWAPTGGILIKLDI